MKIKRILGIDPSSTSTGWAIMRRDSPAWRVVAEGCLQPKHRNPFPRIIEIGEQITELILEHEPDVIAIESTTGKVGRRHGGGGAGLSTYGMAVGVVLWACRVAFWPERVFPIRENVWTEGESKASRAAKIRLQFPEIRGQLDKDKGGDLADAVGVACYLAGRLEWVERSSLTLEDLGLDTMAGA